MFLPSSGVAADPARPPREGVGAFQGSPWGGVVAVSLISPLCLFLLRPVLQARLFSTRAAGCWGRGAARWCCRNRGPRLFGNKLDTRASPEAGADGAATPADTGADGGGGSGQSMMARAEEGGAAAGDTGEASRLVGIVPWLGRQQRSGGAEWKGQQ